MRNISDINKEFISWVNDKRELTVELTVESHINWNEYPNQYYINERYMEIFQEFM